MEEYIKEALEIVKAQASVRTMAEDDIVSMVKKVADGIKAVAEGCTSCANEQTPAIDPKKSIKERSVICLECGKAFKIITRKHLSSHGLTTEEYREKFGMKKKTPLVCKSLQRERRKEMKEMKLWERRGKA
jgi:predicted transcriptional regulator